MTDPHDYAALVERLRWGAWYFDDPFDGKAYASDDPLDAADAIEALIAAGDKLAGYAGHDRDCDGWPKLTNLVCTCGYTETWKAWQEARGDD